MIQVVALTAALVIVVYLWGQANNRTRHRRQTAPLGTTHIETGLPTHSVNHTINTYDQDGWTVIDQSTAKSFGRSTRVAITFRKDRQPDR